MVIDTRMIWRLGAIFLLALALPYQANAASEAELADGAALFEENCSICHQADAIGEPGVVSTPIDASLSRSPTPCLSRHRPPASSRLE